MQCPGANPELRSIIQPLFSPVGLRSVFSPPTERQSASFNNGLFFGTAPVRWWALALERDRQKHVRPQTRWELSTFDFPSASRFARQSLVLLTSLAPRRPFAFTTIIMKSQIASVCGLASLASGLTTRLSMFARQEAASCIDCTIPLVANSDFANGVVADGDYYRPTKTGNWLLANSVNGAGDLSVVQDPQGTYLRNFCSKDHSGFCQGYLAQIVTVQAGVSYNF